MRDTGASEHGEKGLQTTALKYILRFFGIVPCDGCVVEEAGLVQSEYVCAPFAGIATERSVTEAVLGGVGTHRLKIPPFVIGGKI
jgi:hypothetical protein